jgi:hypothetical protein
MAETQPEVSLKDRIEYMESIIEVLQQQIKLHKHLPDGNTALPL